MALVSTQPLTEMSTRSISWGKGSWCVRLTTSPPSCAVVMKSGNLNFQEPSGPLQACKGTALPLHSFRIRASIIQVTLKCNIVVRVACHASFVKPCYKLTHYWLTYLSCALRLQCIAICSLNLTCFLTVSGNCIFCGISCCSFQICLEQCTGKATCSSHQMGIQSSVL